MYLDNILTLQVWEMYKKLEINIPGFYKNFTTVKLSCGLQRYFKWHWFWHCIICQNNQNLIVIMPVSRGTCGLQDWCLWYNHHVIAMLLAPRVMNISFACHRTWGNSAIYRCQVKASRKLKMSSESIGLTFSICHKCVFLKYIDLHGWFMFITLVSYSYSYYQWTKTHAWMIFSLHPNPLMYNNEKHANYISIFYAFAPECICMFHAMNRALGYDMHFEGHPLADFNMNLYISCYTWSLGLWGVFLRTATDWSQY